MIVLRPKQLTIAERIRDAYRRRVRRVLVQAPTAFGKTRVFSYIAEASAKLGNTVRILCHRDELVDQIVDALNDCGVEPAIIAATSVIRSRSECPVSVASVHTLVRRLDKYASPTLLVVDEAHHCAGGNTWSKIIGAYPTARILGVTATPMRLDGRGLAQHFDELIVGPSVRELIEDGHLARPRVFAPPTIDTSGLHIRAGDYKHEESEALMDVPSITGDALAHYKKHSFGLPALVFCTSVAHAHHVAERFRKDNIDAISLNGGTDRGVRRMAVQDFRDGKIKVITSVDIFSEGVDLPGCHVGIFLRPTASLGLYLQQCGRILRPAPGKTHAIIFDHVNNAARFGLPDEDREWTLTTDIIRAKKKAAPSIRVCPKCFAASPARALMCIECGAVFEVKERQHVEERDGELVELTAEELARKRERREQGRAQTREQLMEIARIKGWNPRRVDYILAGRERKRLKKESA
jgi:DNA repair protein RadD